MPKLNNLILFYRTLNIDKKELQGVAKPSKFAFR